MIAHKVEGQEEREPSLLEIKGLLIDIQASIANINKENKALRKEVSDLKASLEFNDKELRDIKSSLATAASAYASLQKKLDATTNELNVTKNTLKDQRHETERLECSLCYDKLVVLCKVLSRNLKDHVWCKSTLIKLLKLKFTDVYFSYS